MPVFREISIGWDGIDYVFTPSNKLLRRIDGGLQPHNTLLNVAQTMMSEQLPLYDIAYIMSEFIRAGGGNVSEDDVLPGLYDDLESNGGAGLKVIIEHIGTVISPTKDVAKNSPAPKVRKKRKTSPGA